MKKYLILLILSFVIFSCVVDNTVYLKPVVVTNEPEDILTNSAILGGEILSEGGLENSEYGIVWSTTFPPTTEDNKIIEGQGLGYFSNIYVEFEPNTTYYYSAYAINEQGVGYGQVWEFTTSAEAPCSPQSNYFMAESNLFIPNGSYTSTGIEIDNSLFGGDYHLKANKGFISDAIEVQIHFDGSFENLLSGAYPLVSDLDFAFNTPNKAVVVMRYSGSNFVAHNGGTVYVERVGDDAFVTLCDLELRGSVFSNQYDATITTQFQVSQ